MQTKSKTLFLTQFAALLAIEAIVCFTPLGSIPIGPIVATLAAVPVVVTGVLLGTGAGAAMGAIAGLFSFIIWTYMPPSPPMAFVFSPFYSFGPFQGNFWSVMICFVPRILVGVVAGLSHKGFKRVCKTAKGDIFVYGLSGILGSLMNTIFVLGGIYVFFGKPYAEVNEVAYEALLGILGSVVLINGIPEAIIAAIAAYCICKPIQKYLLRAR